MSLTGNIGTTKIQEKNLLLQFSSEESKNSNLMGWPLNQHFVLYKVVFLFHSYKVANSINNLFAGFESTKDSKVISGYTIDPSSLEIST